MKWLRRSLYVVGGLLALIVVIGAGGYLWLRTSLPGDGRQRDGVPRLGARWRSRAMATASSPSARSPRPTRSTRSAMRTRRTELFQMDMMRRWGAGRLSEVFGARTVNVDKMMRILGSIDWPKPAWRKIPNEMRVTLEAVRRRRECLSRDAQRHAVAGVRASGLQPGAVAAGGLCCCGAA